MAKIEVTEKAQKVDEQLSTGLLLDPKYVPEFFTNNIVNRVLAYLLGWDKDTKEPVKVKCLTDGTVCVSAEAIPATINETRSGNATDTWTVLTTFTSLAVTVDVFIWDNPAIISRSLDGITWQDDIEIPANAVFSFDAQTKQVRIKNKTTGLVARYQVIGWM